MIMFFTCEGTQYLYICGRHLIVKLLLQILPGARVCINCNSMLYWVKYEIIHVLNRILAKNLAEVSLGRPVRVRSDRISLSICWRILRRSTQSLFLFIHHRRTHHAKYVACSPALYPLTASCRHFRSILLYFSNGHGYITRAKCVFYFTFDRIYSLSLYSFRCARA